MPIQKLKSSLPSLSWKREKGVSIAYSQVSDRAYEFDGRTQWFKNLSSKHRWCTPRQVHGAKVLLVDSSVPDREADGLVTEASGLGLGVFGCDCPGLIIWNNKTLGAAHCGWKGVALGMVAELVGQMKKVSQEDVGEWSAFIGPGICQSCYEVDPPVLNSRRWPDVALVKQPNGKALLDLGKTMVCDLASLGIDQVTNSGICTACDPRLNSFRHQKVKANQVLAVWRD